MKPSAFFHDLNSAALLAGITTFIWFASGMVPLQIAVSGQLGLSAAQTSSGVFIVWLTSASCSLSLSLYYRQPIPITWTIPGLVYLGTLANQFSFSELVGANLFAGLLIVILGLLGLGGRIMQWIPLPIVMGMFAGSILEYVTRMVKATVNDFWVAAPTVAGYFLGRVIGNPRLPPMGIAIVCGGLASLLARQTMSEPLLWTLPTFVIPQMSFSPSAFLAVSLPMVVLSVVLGNVQGLGFLQAQGYHVPVKPVTVLVGISSVLNAILGGCPAIVGRTAVAILAASDAGPMSGRYLGCFIAGVLTFTLAVAAGLVTSLLKILPQGYVLALAGLALLSSFQEAFERAFGGKLRFGALVAFAVSATPFAIGGITSAFWAILAGFLASFLAERRDLLSHWPEKEEQS